MAAEEALRQAVEHRDFTAALSLLEQYRDEVTLRWNSLTSAEDRERMASEVLAFMHWAQRYALIVRTHLHEQSMQLARPRAYVDSGQPRAQVIQMRG